MFPNGDGKIVTSGERSLKFKSEKGGLVLRLAGPGRRPVPLEGDGDDGDESGARDEGAVEARHAAVRLTPAAKRSDVRKFHFLRENSRTGTMCGVQNSVN